jgi:signal peptidase II
MPRSEAGVMGPRAALAAIAGILALDQVTKVWAVDALTPAYVPHDVLGEWVRLTLVYNRGAAFGLSLGPWSRWIFVVLTLVALVVMYRLYVTAAADARWRVRALVLVSGGALGNLVDRLRSERGVVDFLDLGTATWRWPTFNVADIAVSTGAILLAIVLWHEDREEAARGT